MHLMDILLIHSKPFIYTILMALFILKSIQYHFREGGNPLVSAKNELWDSQRITDHALFSECQFLELKRRRQKYHIPRSLRTLPLGFGCAPDGGANGYSVSTVPRIILESFTLSSDSLNWER